ncbi:DUF2381 family protein [Archangium lansingense]|uniref:DUF2381 family protein n=1 Tax=Archangium lansingense TaxID=2995310 RepID=A0ABT4A097_9BACT|nr:DUF2381 family protein [Archangium lansinium]MCY1075072.1 DUF2381 family protein [Archangium lansinium]
MRTSTAVRAAALALTLLARSATAQVPASGLTRTLTVPAPPEADAPAPPIYLRKHMVTTLQFELSIRATTLSGPGAEDVTVQQLGEDAVVLRPSRSLPEWRKPTLTVVAKDGVKHAFTLVMGETEMDVQVHIQRGQCRASEPEDLDALAAELLLREPVRTIRQLSFRQDNKLVSTGGATLQVWGTFALSRLALVALHIESTGEPFSFDQARFENPAGRIQVLGTRQDAEGNISIVVKRPENEADGIPYSVEVSERNGPRKLIAKVIPWPAMADSTPSQPLGTQGHPEADPDGGVHNRELPRP